MSRQAWAPQEDMWGAPQLNCALEPCIGGFSCSEKKNPQRFLKTRAWKIDDFSRYVRVKALCKLGSNWRDIAGTHGKSSTPDAPHELARSCEGKLLLTPSGTGTLLLAQGLAFRARAHTSERRTQGSDRATWMMLKTLATQESFESYAHTA